MKSCNPLKFSIRIMMVIWVGLSLSSYCCPLGFPIWIILTMCWMDWMMERIEFPALYMWKKCSRNDTRKISDFYLRQFHQKKDIHCFMLKKWIDKQRGIQKITRWFSLDSQSQTLHTKPPKFQRQPAAFFPPDNRSYSYNQAMNKQT